MEQGSDFTATDSEDLAKLLADAPKHKAIIKAQLSVWFQLLRDQPLQGFAMADRPETPEEVLTCLAVFGDQRTRSRIAMRNKLSETLSELLETDPLVGSATHPVHAPDIDEEKLKRFLSHRWPTVRSAAAARLASLESADTPDI